MNDTELASLIAPNLLRRAQDFCKGTDNAEYVRGQAELIIDVTPGINQDHKQQLMDLLVLGSQEAEYTVTIEFAGVEARTPQEAEYKVRQIMDAEDFDPWLLHMTTKKEDA